MSTQFDLSLSVDPTELRPLVVQIVEGLSDAIRSGSLRPGERVPSSRRLSETLGVHRNTVLAAYDELTAQGWITAAQGRGTFVSRGMPATRRRVGPPHRRHPERLGFTLAPERPPDSHMIHPVPKGVISLARAVPDLRLAPVADLTRAYRRVLQRSGRSLLDYGHEYGHPRLREQLAIMLSASRGLDIATEDVLVTAGTQQALHLVARSIVASPGDVIAVESLGYPPAWHAFEAAGASVVAVPVDGRGLRVDRLTALADRRPVRAVYLTPHHQYPTTAVLSADRRMALLALARARRIAIIEDDYDHEVGRPVLPLASTDRAGVVVYVGTLSKILAPGVRIGYVVAARALLDRMAALRRSIDRHGDSAVERAVAELLEDGVVQRHSRRMQRVYRERREVLVEALRSELHDVVSFEVPSGGMALWARVARGVDVDRWAKRALAAGVYFVPGRAFAFDRRSRPHLRLAFAPVAEAAIRQGVARMRASLHLR